MDRKNNNIKENSLGRIKKDIINKNHPALARQNSIDNRLMSRTSYIDTPVQSYEINNKAISPQSYKGEPI